MADLEKKIQDNLDMLRGLDGEPFPDNDSRPAGLTDSWQSTPETGSNWKISQASPRPESIQRKQALLSVHYSSVLMSVSSTLHMYHINTLR